ncbi:MAG: hypothetical protein HUJ68_03035 [Clostridia bacterium]|nr:hypothetical protein [Clostridia bacterium]
MDKFKKLYSREAMAEDLYDTNISHKRKSKKLMKRTYHKIARARLKREIEEE